MGLFDIIGPVMVGPSSSHTAGACRIGLFARGLAGGNPSRATLALHGSFAATGEGHGTHLALVGGLLGFQPDDERMGEALTLAQAEGPEVSFTEEDLGDVHPNSVELRIEGPSGALQVCASSVGGGAIRIWRIDGFDVELGGTYPTILFVYPDRPGAVAVVSSVLAHGAINIAAIKAHRTVRGGLALMEVQLDEAPTPQLLEALKQLPNFQQVRFVPSLEGGR